MATSNLFRICAAIAIAALVDTAQAEPVGYEIDKAHSRIYFEISHRGYSTLVGVFHDWDGELTYDSENPANSAVSIVIQSASADLFSSGLNGVLGRAGFLGPKEYPEIRFASTAVEVIGEGQLRLVGDLTLKGETHPVTMDVRQNATKLSDGAPYTGWSGFATIDRSQFGINFGIPSIPADVRIRAEIEAGAAAR